MRNIIQIGLAKWAEWSYLTQKNWFEHMHSLPEHQRLPKFLCQRRDPFRYFGIDVSVSSIYHVREKFSAPNRYFICCGLDYMFGVKNFANSHYTETDRVWNDFLDEKDNTYFVFVQMGELIKALGIEDITALIIDVDGYEKEVLCGLGGWEIKPEFISVELTTAHMKRSRLAQSMIEDTFMYTHIKTMPQLGFEHKNIWASHNFDCHYLKNELYHKYQDSIQISHEYCLDEDEWLNK